MDYDFRPSTETSHDTSIQALHGLPKSSTISLVHLWELPRPSLWSSTDIVLSSLAIKYPTSTHRAYEYLPTKQMFREYCKGLTRRSFVCRYRTPLNIMTSLAFASTSSCPCTVPLNDRNIGVHCAPETFIRSISTMRMSKCTV